MFCNNCGNQLGTNDVFCQKCGKRVEVDEALKNEEILKEESVDKEPAVGEAPVYNTVVTEEVPPVEEMNISNTEETTVENADMLSAEPEKPKKKKKKWVKWTIIGAIIAALGTGTVFGFPYIQNAFFRTVMSEEAYFQHVIKNNITEFTDSAFEGYADEMTEYLNGQAMYGDVQIEVGNKTKQLVRQYDSGIDIDWLNNVSMTGVSGYTDGEIYANYDIKLNGTNITGVDMIVNNDAICIGLPGLTNKTIRIETYGSMAIATMINEIYKVVPDEEVLKEIIVRYVTCLAEGIDDVEEENDTVKAGDVEKKYLKLTAKIDEKAAEKSLKSVLKEAKRDKDIEKIIKDVCGLSTVNQNPDEVYGDFQNAIDEILEEIDLSGADLNFDFVIWVDMKGDIAGMGIEADGVEASFVNALNGRTLGTLFSIKSPEFNVVFEGDGETKSNKFNGNYALKVNGISAVDVEVKDVDIKLMKEDVFNGQVTIAPSAMVKGMLSGMGDEAVGLLSDAKIVYKSDTTEKYMDKEELSIHSGNEMLLAIKGSISKADSDIPVMGNYIDINNADEANAMSNEVWYNLRMNLMRAGVPYDLLS